MEILKTSNSEQKTLAASPKTDLDYSSGFKSLLAIRKFSDVLEKHHAELIQIEKDQYEKNEHALIVVEANATPEIFEKWKISVANINDSVFSINQALNVSKEKVARKDRSDSSEMWQQFDQHLAKFKESCKNLASLGCEILPDSDKLAWKNGICTLEETFLPLVVSYAEACRVELQMIEKYTPEELNKINKIILNHIPKDYTSEEVDQYKKEYLAAVVDFKQEFHEEKNLWDKFLDILAGGTHQSPAEHVMMERWLEGDKHDL